MMAKMFYTLDETKASLGRNEEEIKQLSREGRLREFRDGPRLMFKADQVEALKAEIGGLGGGHDSGPSPSDSIGIADTGAPIGLVDSRGASGSGISLVDTDAGMRGPGGSLGGGSMGGSMGGSLGGSMGGSAIGLAGSSSSGSAMPLKEDTALAADLGLGGSMGGV